MINLVLGYDVRVEDGASVEYSVVLSDVTVGSGARLRRCIVDKKVRIPPGTAIGFDQEEDKRRGLHLSPAGITVVPKEFVFAAVGRISYSVFCISYKRVARSRRSG